MIEIKTALFNDYETACNRCDAGIKAARNSPYGNRAEVEISGGVFTASLTLCVECLEVLAEDARDVVARLRHEHVWMIHEEYGNICKDCGMGEPDASAVIGNLNVA